MSDEPENLVLRLLGEIRTEIASLRDDVNVLTAIVQRLDNSHTRLLTEIRATHAQVSRHGERLRRLEGLAPSDDE
jgi:hypothetical protein